MTMRAVAKGKAGDTIATRLRDYSHAHTDVDADVDDDDDEGLYTTESSSESNESSDDPNYGSGNL